MAGDDLPRVHIVPGRQRLRGTAWASMHADYSHLFMYCYLQDQPAAAVPSQILKGQNKKHNNNSQSHLSCHGAPVAEPATRPAGAPSCTRLQLLKLADKQDLSIGSRTSPCRHANRRPTRSRHSPSAPQALTSITFSTTLELVAVRPARLLQPQADAGCPGCLGSPPPGLAPPWHLRQSALLYISKQMDKVFPDWLQGRAHQQRMPLVA